MRNFKFAINIECANAAKAAQSATNKTLGAMTEAEAAQRIVNATMANDGMTRAIVIAPTEDKTEVWVKINRNIPLSEQNDTARAIRPAIRALGGKPYLRYKDGKLLTKNIWLVPAENYKRAMFWRKENTSATIAL